MAISFCVYKWETDKTYGVVTLVLCGDFYETYGEDAEKFIEVCGTPYGTKEGLVMTGIPAHAINSYLVKCLSAGVSVQIID